VIRGVFFDAGGILYDRASSSGEFLRRTLAELGHATTLSASDEERRRELHTDASLGRISVQDYWSGSLALLGVPAAERATLVALLERFADDIVPAAGARDTLVELRRRGKKLGVVTDTTFPLARKMRWLERVGVADLLDVVSCSSDLGLKKPDPAIYRDALRRAGVAPEEAAFVGHSPEELAGARSVGMATIAVHGEAGAVADRAVASLSALLDLDLLAP
jgi:HAD superfamily hydrolase (TIGR01509 family)